VAVPCRPDAPKSDGGLPLRIAAQDALGVVVAYIAEDEQLGAPGIHAGEALGYGSGASAKCCRKTRSCAWRGIVKPEAALAFA
jgi:hypothetical protein